ncbi:cilia- and flagella-associated protein 251 isoform X2 [Oncorhynchus mykiss]|uniref:cilia- and flagella-associated protein 251 isoform X2 n=1 Tax=Oncorhynchus mykiss TaxID=8022 RepID=UPI0018786F50|nr:cilia- and flagella-associated protein 251 isoform X2 [Oncorhynchus mykiss]
MKVCEEVQEENAEAVKTPSVCEPLDIEDLEESTVKESPVPPKDTEDTDKASTEGQQLVEEHNPDILLPHPVDALENAYVNTPPVCEPLIIEDLEDSPDKEYPAPRKTEDVECASAQGQEQIQVDKDRDKDKDHDMPLPCCLDNLKKRFYQSRDRQIRERHWAQFRAETLRVAHQGIVVLQRDLELELERVREGLEDRRQRRERDHYTLAQVKRERQKKREEQIKGWMEKWMIGREEESQGEEGAEEGETEEEEKEGEEESEKEEESEDEEGDTEGAEEKEKEEKVEEGDREGSEEESEADEESEEEDGIETICKEVKMQMHLIKGDIEHDMKNDYEQNKNREVQDRKMLTTLLQCLESVYQTRTEEILGKIGMLWDIMINNMLQDLHGRRAAQKSVSAQTAQYLHFCHSPRLAPITPLTEAGRRLLKGWARGQQDDEAKKTGKGKGKKKKKKTQREQVKDEEKDSQLLQKEEMVESKPEENKKSGFLQLLLLKLTCIQ